MKIFLALIKSLFRNKLQFAIQTQASLTRCILMIKVKTAHLAGHPVCYIDAVMGGSAG
jgi:hypothetical protein